LFVSLSIINTKTKQTQITLGASTKKFANLIQPVADSGFSMATFEKNTNLKVVTKFWIAETNKAETSNRFKKTGRNRKAI
jgi:hypothetical protein